MATATDLKNTVTRNVDMKTAISAAVGMGLFGLVTFVAIRSGIGPLKDAANIVKGGK